MLAKIQAFLNQHLGGLANEKTHPPTNPQDTIELATAVLLVEIGLADSVIQKEELEQLERLLQESFDLDPQAIEQLIKAAKDETDHAISLHRFTRLLNEQLDQRERNHIVEKMWAVAFADHIIDKYEEYYIRKIADLLYVPHTAYIKAKLQAEEASAHINRAKEGALSTPSLDAD